MTCLTPASLAARIAAVACLSSSVPSSQKLVTRKRPCAPANAASSVRGRARSASTTSSARSRCVSGVRTPDTHRDLADEVVEADLARPRTLDAAFAGAHGLFLVTNFWEEGTDELKQAT